MMKAAFLFPAIMKRSTDHSALQSRRLDRDGKPFSREIEGLLAICLQHEIDHLDGKLFRRLSVAPEAQSHP